MGNAQGNGQIYRDTLTAHQWYQTPRVQEKRSVPSTHSPLPLSKEPHLELSLSDVSHQPDR